MFTMEVNGLQTSLFAQSFLSGLSHYHEVLRQGSGSDKDVVEMYIQEITLDKHIGISKQRSTAAAVSLQNPREEKGNIRCSVNA